MYQFFSKVGIEPTFTVSPEDYPVLRLKKIHPIDRGDMHQRLIREIASILDRKRGWVGMAEIDNTDVEIPSKEQYTTLEGLMEAYAKLQKQIQPFGLYPSTVVDYYNDGGCHINVDMQAVISLGDMFEHRFNHNLLMFLNKYPSLVWSMLTPNDNASSKIYSAKSIRNTFYSFLNMTQKEWCAHYRSYNGCRYWELRFFMMPRTDEEMVFQLKVADKFIRLIYELTKTGKEVKSINSSERLRTYNWPTAKAELLKVARWLGLEKEPLWELKFQSLRERIEVQGKEFLV